MPNELEFQYFGCVQLVCKMQAAWRKVEADELGKSMLRQWDHDAMLDRFRGSTCDFILLQSDCISEKSTNTSTREQTLDASHVLRDFRALGAFKMSHLDGNGILLDNSL